MSLEAISMLVFALILVLFHFGRIERTLARQERQLKALLLHMGISGTGLPEPSKAVLETLAINGKIAAIKIYRSETGLGLIEAKTAVEAAIEAGGPLPGG